MTCYSVVYARSCIHDLELFVNALGAKSSQLQPPPARKDEYQPSHPVMRYGFFLLIWPRSIQTLCPSIPRFLRNGRKGVLHYFGAGSVIAPKCFDRHDFDYFQVHIWHIRDANRKFADLNSPREFQEAAFAGVVAMPA
jgi:hypothetical protein